MLSTLQRLRPRYNFEDRVGDGVLAGLVVGDVEVAQKVFGVLGGFLHGRHPGSLLGGETVEDSFEKLDAQCFGDQFANNRLPVGLEDEIRPLSRPRCLGFINHKLCNLIQPGYKSHTDMHVHN